MSDEFDEAALRYHREPKPGKLAITATQSTQRWPWYRALTLAPTRCPLRPRCARR